MGLYLLIAAGILFAALFALNNLLKTIFRRNRIGFIDILLTFMTTLVLLAGLIGAQMRTDADARITQSALVAGAGLAAFSLLILLLELFRPQRLKGSRGVLGLYSGLLVIAAVFAVPLTDDYFAQATPTAIVQAQSAQNTEVMESTDDPLGIAEALLTALPLTRTATEPPTETAQPSNTPRPTRTASSLATRFQYSTRTPTPTPTLVTPCVASVQYNLRLRAAPDRDAETLLVIPYSTTIELFGRGGSSENGALWWYASYEGQQGWVDGQYMIVSSACDSLPPREAG